MTVSDKDNKEKPENHYSEIATLAAQTLNSPSSFSPREAWESAANYYYPNSEKEFARVKDCPRIAFLCLCKEGCVKGVPPGNYTSSVKIRKKAIEGLKKLIKNPNFTLKKLKESFRKNNKGQNDQNVMDVVFGLFKEEFIRKKFIDQWG